MKIPARILSALAVLAPALPASAQDSAADLVREAMANAGVYGGYTVQQNARGLVRPQDDADWNGLVLSEAYSTTDRAGDLGWSFVQVIENHTDRAYCIRPYIRGVPRGQTYYLQDVNQIVEPGKTLLIAASADRSRAPSFSISSNIAYWRPDYSAPNGSYCRSVAPDGLDDWLSGPSDRYDFAGSRR